MIAIIIPAHNEEAVIARLLDGLLADAPDGTLEVHVVCNGCHDRTGIIAERYSPTVQVHYLDIAAKWAAINEGDRVAIAFPRFIIDADIQVSYAAIKRAAQVLERDEAVLAAPRLKVDCSRASWGVRAYYRAWQRSAYFDSSFVGSGIYGLSERGRRRFECWPEAIADDLFVRLQCSPAERRCVEEHSFTVSAPTNIKDLIKIKSRVRTGIMQMAKMHPEIFRHENSNWRKTLSRLMPYPSAWLDGMVYSMVWGVATTLARRNVLAQDVSGWARDESSRCASSMEKEL